LAAHSTLASIPAGQEVLREGQYVKVIPFVVSGMLSVFSRYRDKDLLLYYIMPGESCIMSFTSALHQSPSRVVALAEEETTALLLPAQKLSGLLSEIPELSTLFFNAYGSRYIDLIDTVNQVVFNRLDERILTHIRQRTEISGTSALKITHKQLANELGTTREVISRLIKALEREKKLEQKEGKLRVL
jgi:CRP/FNR family transcriptional regulator